jgi:outer membrane protein TolC
LVERAVSANPDLRLAEASIRQARATRIGVSAGRWPTVDTSGTYQKSYAGGSAGSGTVDLFRAGLDAAWELDFFGGVRRSVKAAEAQVHAATARTGVATADLFPKFSLTGSFGYASDTLGSLMKFFGRSDPTG